MIQDRSLFMRSLASAFALTFIAAACGTDADDDRAADEPPPVTSQYGEPATVAFDTTTVTFVTSGGEVGMVAEVAERPDQRAYGLMDRDELAADRGMIFFYEQVQDGSTGFWMYRTRIPLDIAYFDSSGRIVAIHQMMPCTSLDPQRCTGYAAGVPFYGAVEANRGYFMRNNIGIGDRVVVPGRIGD